MGRKTGKRHTEEPILRIPDELRGGRTADEICRTYGLAQSTHYGWNNQYGEIDRDQLSRLRELEDENRRLKRNVARRCWTVTMCSVVRNTLSLVSV